MSSDFLKNDSGAVFGMFLFILLVVFATVSWLVVSPVMDGIDAGFNQAYRDEHLSAEGQQTTTMLKFIFDNVLVLFVVIIGGVMVVNRAIRKGNLGGG